MKNRFKAAAIVSCMLGAWFVAPQAMAADDQMDGIHSGDVLVRLRSISIVPEVTTSGGSTLSAINAGVNNATVPELDLTYMIRDSIGVELILATSRHQVTSSLGGLGGVNVLPPTLLLQYHFNHQGRVRPYVGAGLNYTYFYNDGLHVGGQGVQITHSSFGPALQAGVDIQVAKNLFLNADIKKVWMRTEATLGNTELGTLHIDPTVIGVGIGMKF
ncbi:Outer membrane protein W [Paraburkholderia ultramafica]|uniref:Outer membrane protein W n=1 Tax=Paraburkholderia ultramafica TaxID=1544867 RepID=A0A6S7CBW8_9BURK|nr:OmpW family outer membrane protein [Paraburkholderia ultramafica]CAB3805648.1 Outer membrane protein W [Paraburkholderia ultramafica]